MPDSHEKTLRTRRSVIKLFVGSTLKVVTGGALATSIGACMPDTPNQHPNQAPNTSLNQPTQPDSNINAIAQNLNTSVEYKLTRNIEESVRLIKDQYNIDIDFQFKKNNDGTITATELSLKDKALALAVVKAELDKYPPEIWNDKPITTIILIQQLMTNGNTAAGSNELTSDFSTSIVYLGWDGIDHQTYFAKTINHEISHVLFFLQKPPEKVSMIRARMEEITTKSGLAYTRQEKAPFLEKFYLETTGFANLYGMMNPEEDMATIAEYLFFSYDTLMARLQGDKVLEKKVQLIMDLYLEWSKGIMTLDWWDRTRAIHNIQY